MIEICKNLWRCQKKRIECGYDIFVWLLGKLWDGSVWSNYFRLKKSIKLMCAFLFYRVENQTAIFVNMKDFLKSCHLLCKKCMVNLFWACREFYIRKGRLKAPSFQKGILLMAFPATSFQFSLTPWILSLSLWNISSNFIDKSWIQSKTRQFLSSNQICYFQTRVICITQHLIRILKCFQGLRLRLRRHFLNFLYREPTTYQNTWKLICREP